MKRIALIAISSFILFGCSQNEKKLDKITMGVLAWPGASPVYIGIEKGFFKEAGLDVTARMIENYDSRRSALISGQIDIDYNTMDQLLIYHENGFNAQAFAVGDFSTGGDGIVSKKTIQSIDELKGKTVTYAEATPSDFFLRYILMKNNLTFKDIIPVPVADPQIAGNTIIAEQADAGVTYEPWLTKAKENKNLHILITTKEYPYLIPGFLIANGETLEKEKGKYKRFTQAWFKSIDFFYSHPSEAKEIMSRNMGISMEDLNSILETITLLTKKQSEIALNKNEPNNMYELCNYISKFWKESGFITKPVNANNLINNTMD